MSVLAPSFEAEEAAKRPGSAGGFAEALARWVSEFAPAYRVSLASYAMIWPCAAAVVTTVCVMLRPRPEAPEALGSIIPLAGAARFHPIELGIVAATLVWLAFPLIHRRFATAPAANETVYHHLCLRAQQISARLKALGEETDKRAVQASQAYSVAKTHLEYVAKRLDARRPESQGAVWGTYMGYTDVLARLNRADEALIAIEPPAEIVGGSLYDLLRLQGSRIEHHDQLVSDLKLAVNMLLGARYEQVRDFFTPPVAVQEERFRYALDVMRRDDLSHQAPALPASNEDGQAARHDDHAPAPAGVDAATDTQARALLQQIRRVINEYRVEQWNGLIRIRNRLQHTICITAAVVYLLLVLALLLLESTPWLSVNDQIKIIGAGAAFFVVGALVGLYNRLRADSEREAAVEDFGLSTTHLTFTPFFSGLAAVGGVMVTLALPALADFQGDTQTKSWAQIFELTPALIIIAAVFGATPSLLPDRLRQAERYMANLKSTQPQAQTTTKSAFE